MDYPVIDMKATGARIVELRKKNHLRVEDISRFMGFETGQAVYKWQRGESLPSVDNLFALSRLFGTSVDDILCGREEDEMSSSFFVFVGPAKLEVLISGALCAKGARKCADRWTMGIC